MLGQDAIATKKQEHGSTLIILGIEVEMAAGGFKLRVSPAKARL